MKKGFTLIELIVVIAVIAVISVGAIILFVNIDKDTSLTELEKIYKEIQNSASLYLDLNDTWLEQFVDKKEIYVQLNELKNSNYIDQDLTNPLTGDEIDTSYLVKLFIKTEYPNKYVSSCVVNIVSSDGENEVFECIANNHGSTTCRYECDCVDEPDSSC